MMTTQGVLRLGLLNILLALASDAWLLAQSGLNESSYHVRHLSMHFSRVFLSVNVENNGSPTLIEAQWPVSYFPMPTVVFPHRDVHANGDQKDCSLVQQAHWSQVDGLSRLWVMDVGFPGGKCPPRLFVFDLMRNNAELLRIDCGRHIPKEETHTLVVQMGPKGSDCEQERHIYFIFGQLSELVAYDILEQTWSLRSLASSKYEMMNQTFPITPVDFTFGLQGELILADQDGALYSTVDRMEINGKSELKSNSLNNDLELTPLGNLLGTSRSMIMDSFGTLYYVIPKFGAVVRCTKLSNITAESNEIIYLTSKNIQQIFFASNEALWVLSDRVLKAQDMCFPNL
ncbi:uncharacterized protein Dana_GF23705 [Drosophila ananassae]|uniref:Yellow-k n=1 Tax=Drosophila ananassae TaxID=7217 RepID=B3M704_DROAN|nr:uncharacterized protein LOC6506345 [Drosophila ananassae]EDV40869.2 uncharacterized protein Dana_GF23705 [Drosophila ananassae]